jgi:hypothetical protein
LSIGDKKQAMLEIHNGPGCDADLPTFHAKQCYLDLCLIEWNQYFIRDLLRLAGSIAVNVSALVAEIPVAGLPIRGIHESHELLIRYEATDFILAPFGESDIWFEVDVARYLVALDVNDSVDVVFELIDLRDTVRNGHPSFPCRKIVESLTYRFR